MNVLRVNFKMARAADLRPHKQHQAISSTSSRAKTCCSGAHSWHPAGFPEMPNMSSAGETAQQAGRKAGDHGLTPGHHRRQLREVKSPYQSRQSRLQNLQGRPHRPDSLPKAARDRLCRGSQAGRDRARQRRAGQHRSMRAGKKFLCAFVCLAVQLAFWTGSGANWS